MFKRLNAIFENSLHAPDENMLNWDLGQLYETQLFETQLFEQQIGRNSFNSFIPFEQLLVRTIVHSNNCFSNN